METTTLRTLDNGNPRGTSFGRRRLMMNQNVSFPVHFSRLTSSVVSLMLYNSSFLEYCKYPLEFQ